MSAYHAQSSHVLLLPLYDQVCSATFICGQYKPHCALAHQHNSCCSLLKAEPSRPKHVVVVQVTHLFRDVLHGWGQILLSVNVSPCAKDYDETSHVLKVKPRCSLYAFESLSHQHLMHAVYNNPCRRASSAVCCLSLEVCSKHLSAGLAAQGTSNPMGRSCSTSKQDNCV